jgi:hypothetical protein
MSVTEKAETVHALRKPGDTDAVTFSWADPDAGLYGLARVATGIGADAVEQPSALAIAFSGREPVGAVAVAGAEASGAVSATVDEPLRRWSLHGAGELEFSLRFAATTPSAELGGRDKAAKAGGLEGYEQLCRVSGTVKIDGRSRAVDGLGQRGHAWGNPDWDKIALTRSVGAWLGDGTGVVVTTVRPTGVTAHADEAIWAAALDGERARAVDDARLSTTMDDAGRQIRAGLELWLEKNDDYPFRGTGEVVAGSTLELGALRLDVAFFRWHIEGHTGTGRYDVIRRTA